MTDSEYPVTTDDCTLSDGRTLAYAIGGARNGVPVVAHHGTPGSRLFGALLADVAADLGVRLVVPDRPGYGRSTAPPSGWDWTDWQADLTALLEAESIDRAPAIGFSGGGPFALAAANSDRLTRVGLVSAAVPPVENGLTSLSKVPYAVRILFRLSRSLAEVRGPAAVVEQYTDRSVSAAVATAVAADFQEALRQGGRAVARENQLFANTSAESIRPDVPVCAWHGTQDENTPLSSMRSFVRDTESVLLTQDADHLETLLDCRSAVLRWLATEPSGT